MADTRLRLAAELNDDQWSVIDDAAERLEQLWKVDACPEITPLIPPPGNPIRTRLLVEIIKIDQEFHWQAGQQKALESYLEEWPELEQQPAVKAELLEAECVTCGAFGSFPSADDLRRRFPELSNEVREQALLAAEMARDAGLATVNLAPNSTPRNKLRIRCPHCHNPVDLPLDCALTDLTCSACGSHFSLVDQSQATRVAPLLSTMGRFELVERLGVGGFGSVWKARDKELDRTVAIKIPRQDAMTADEQEKFLREARAAAQLRHPNIVSVHEVGRDGDSLYIVSDFVRGVTLADWLTGQQLTSREAAELCARIADALHHAHENGIIHRDLKPANVMIDPDGQPHLMDFGLARREVGEVTVTIDGQVLGTPAYMSPEQAQGEAHTADRRSDVYSLGVILFQLLTGELPFRGNTRMLIHQVIHDEPPSPRKFRANIPRDLETITLKCVEKDPSRRYQTAHDVAAELRRFLSGDPIHARPVGRVSRFWRWAKRKPAVAALSFATALLLVILAIGGPAAAVRLAVLKREAEMSAQEAQTEAAKATAISDLLQQMLESANPDEAKGVIYTVRQLLDDSSARLKDQLTDQPEVEATIRATIGKAYWRLGMADKAEPHLKAALELRRVTLGPDHKAVADSLVDYAWNLAEALNHDRALECVEEALSIYRHNGSTPRPILRALWAKQRFLISQGKYAESDATADEALAVAGDLTSVDIPVVANILHALGDSRLNQGQYFEAEEAARKAVLIHRRLHGPEHPETAWGLFVLGRALANQDKFQEAESTLRESVEIFRRQYGNEHTSTKTALVRLSYVLLAKGDRAGFETLVHQQLDETTGNSIGIETSEWIARAQAYADLGKWKQAVEAGEKVISMLEKTPASAAARGELRNLAPSYSGQAWILATSPNVTLRNPGLAVQLAKVAVKLSPDDVLIWNALGVAQYRAGKMQEAVETLHKSIEIRGGNSWDWFVLAMAEWQLGNKDAAREWYDKAVSWMDENNQSNKDLIRFRAEGAEMLAIPKNSPPEAPDT